MQSHDQREFNSYWDVLSVLADSQIWGIRGFVLPFLPVIGKLLEVHKKKKLGEWGLVTWKINILQTSLNLDHKQFTYNSQHTCKDKTLHKKVQNEKVTKKVQ